MSFVDRTEAGKQLAAALERFRGDEVVVLALPRGGVPVAAEVARHLGAPIDLLLVRKVGVPYQPELAMGAVVDGAEPIVVRNEPVIRLAGISAVEFEAACGRELVEIERRRKRYLGTRPPAKISGRTVIIVDDGVATGATVRAAIRAVRRRKPRGIVVATPVAPEDTIAALSEEADEVVCLRTPEPFGAIGLYYRDFSQLADEDVVRLLRGAGPSASSPRDEAGPAAGQGQDAA